LSNLTWLAAALLVVAGCASTTTAASTTLSSLGPPPSTTTTTTVPVTIPSVEGYVVAVRDGRMFDLQVGPTTRLVALTHIVTPPLGTCEGDEALRLLGSIAIGHRLRLDPDGIVWKDDLDVAMAMVNFGRAKATDERYAAADAQSVDLDCSATTTSTTLAPVVIQPQSKPKTTSKPRTTTARTTPETKPPPETAPPAARPAPTEPPETPPETKPPDDTKKPKDEPPKDAPPKDEPPST
jgi:hypothetical protein